MKVGFILECTAQGPDAAIYPYVAGRLCPTIQIEKPVTLVNKQRVMTEGATNASILLQSGCDFVFIIWDRMPHWGGPGRCAEDTEELLAAMRREMVDEDRVFLCCVDEMLESWMVADGRAITAYFQSLTTRRIEPFADCKTKAQQTKPKDRITKYNGRYNDFTDNFKIVKLMPEFDRAARRNTSFGNFVGTVRRMCPA